MPGTSQATTIMVIRHAEKPDTYNGQDYSGVDAAGTVCGAAAAKHLVTLGWQRTGGLVSLFAPPWGPKNGLAKPQFLYAADPDSKDQAAAPAPGSSEEEHSQRPYETLTALAAKLNLSINKTFSKNHYDKMVKDALQQPGVVLICWQHEDIPLKNAAMEAGISQSILTQTGTDGTMSIPSAWPKANGKARYDLVFVFSRPKGSGPIAGFNVVPQFLLPGDLGWPLGA